MTRQYTLQKSYLSLVCFAAYLIIFSLLYLTFWLIDNQATADNTATALESAELTTISTNHESSDQTEDRNHSAFDPYWDFQDTDYLAANFDQLHDLNPEIVAWLAVPNTNINYPVVQHQDNSFYLNHSVDQSTNAAGWVFMDYRNQTSPERNRNTIIYAHGRQDGSMFGSLKQTLATNWHADPDHLLIKISTPETNSIWQIFSTYQIPDTNDYIQTTFEDDAEFLNFLQLLQKRSNFDYHTTLYAHDHILTLSTCANISSSEKIVVHAKLIQSQKR